MLSSSMPSLTPKQQAALNKAPASSRKAMKKLYMDQARPVSRPTARAPVNVPRAKALVRQPPRVRAGPAPNYMDPMCKVPMPALLSDGKALPHTALISKDFILSKYDANDPKPIAAGFPVGFSTGPTILLATNSGNCATVGMLIHTVIAPAATAPWVEGRMYEVANEMFNIPTLSAHTENSITAGGHPSAGRSMKLGVTVINNTNALKRGGRVTHLNTYQRLPNWTPEPGGHQDWTGTIEAVKAAPDRRRINGDTLLRARQLIGTVVDSNTYHQFEQWMPDETRSTFSSHVLDNVYSAEDAYGHRFYHRRPMSTVAYVFDPTDEPQDYSITIRASFYTRWALTSVPGQSMSPIPVAGHELITKVHASNNANAAELTEVGAGGATLGAFATAKALASAAAGRAQQAENAGADLLGLLEQRAAELEAAAALAAP